MELTNIFRVVGLNGDDPVFVNRSLSLVITVHEGIPLQAALTHCSFGSPASPVPIQMRGSRCDPLQNFATRDAVVNIPKRAADFEL